MIWRMEVCSSACRQLRIMVEAFSCPICDFTTKWRGNLHPHIWSIHGGQTFQCTLCDNTFTLKATLQKHMKLVHEDQTFQCQCLHCGFTFNQKAHLYAHIKSVHEGQKFPCPHCEYKATEKGSLQSTMANPYMFVT